MLKFEIVNNSLKITNEALEVILLIAKKDVFAESRSLYLDVPLVNLYNLNGGFNEVVFQANLSQCEDSVGTPFTIDSFITFVEDNLGFSMGAIPQTTGIHTLRKPISGQYTSAFVCGGNAQNSSYATDDLMVYPYYPANSFNASNFSIRVNSSSVGGLCKILVYSDLNGIPDQKLYQSNVLDCSTLGVKTSITTSFSFSSGTAYWIGITTNSGITFSGISFLYTYPIGLSATLTSITSLYGIGQTYNDTPQTFPSYNESGGSIVTIAITIE